MSHSDNLLDISPDSPPPPVVSRPPNRPTLTSTISSASNSAISSMWSGLIRRFSAEDSEFSDFESPIPEFHENGYPSQPAHPKDGINGVFSPTIRIASPFRPPPLDPLILEGCRSDTARLLSHAVAEEIRTMVPERLRLMESWKLTYSLEQDGASLITLYQRARMYENKRVGFVLVVKDQEGGVFGAYLSEYPRPAPSYFGNGECFLWRASTIASLPPPPSADTTHLTRNTTLGPRRHPLTGPKGHSMDSSSSPGFRSGESTPGPSETIRFKAFPYSGLNDFYMHCETGFLSVGSGGGHYGLWLDDSLNVGHSSQCETFGNEPLSDEGRKFGILGVELWVMGA